jgi:hypothetical protein
MRSRRVEGLRAGQLQRLRLRKTDRAGNGQHREDPESSAAGSRQHWTPWNWKRNLLHEMSTRRAQEQRRNTARQ